MKPRHGSSLLTLCALATVISSPLTLAQPAPVGPPLAVAPETEESLVTPTAAVDMTADGRTVVVFWEEARTLWSATFDAKGRREGLARLETFFFLDDRPAPAVATGTDGSLFVARYGRSLTDLAVRLYGRGAPGPATALPIPPPAEHRPEDADVCAGGGGFRAAWTAGGEVWMRAFAADGTPRGAARRVAREARGDVTGLDLDCAADGRFAVAWIAMPPGVCRLRLFNAAADPLGPAATTNPQPLEGGPNETPAVALAADGSAVVLWRQGFQRGPMARFYDPAGSPLGAAREFAAPPLFSPPGFGAVAFDDGGTFLFWADAGRPEILQRPVPVFGQSFGPDGQARGEPAYLTTWWDSWSGIDAASDGRGRVAIAWGEFEGGVRMQLFDAAGAGRLTLDTRRLAVDEGGGEAVLAVRRTHGSAGTVSVDYAAFPAGIAGRASPGTDFEPVRGTLTFADGTSGEQTLAVPVVDDALAEASETFAVRLTAPTGGAELGVAPHALVEIRDDDETTLATLGEAQRLSDHGGRGPSVTRNDRGELCAAWQEPWYGMAARCFDPRGGVRGELTVAGVWGPPAVAVDPGGGFFLVGQSEEQGPEGRAVATWLYRYRPRTGWLGPLLLHLGPPSRFVVNLRTAPRLEVAAAADGSLILMGNLEHPAREYQLYRFSAAGQPLGEPVLLVRRGSLHGHKRAGALVRGVNGDVLAVWERWAEVMGALVSIQPDGQLATSRIFTLSSGPPGRHGRPAAAALPDGRFLAVWRTYDARGSYLAGRFVLADGARPAPGPELALTTVDPSLSHGWPQVTAAGEELLVAWEDQGKPSRLTVQLFDLEGRARGSALRLADMVRGWLQGEIALAGSTGEVTVVWTDRSIDPAEQSWRHPVYLWRLLSRTALTAGTIGSAPRPAATSLGIAQRWP